jgi:hypothetical protein
VRSVAVVTGRTRDDLVEIREGLKGGETVVIDPPDGLSEGAKIRSAAP